MIFKYHDKGSWGKPCLQITPGSWNAASLHMTVRKGKLTERSSPRRTFPERSRWVRVVAVNGLALSDWERWFTPATWRRSSSISTPGNKRSVGSVYKRPHQTAGLRLAQVLSPKVELSSLPSPWGEQESHRHSYLTAQKKETELGSFCSTSDVDGKDLPWKS